MISMIVGIGKNNEMGMSGDMPWKRDLPADLSYFKKITSGQTVVMGRKTYESIGKKLPNRTNVILTRDATFETEDCEVYQNINDILEMANNNEGETFIIGGAEIYKAFLPYADKLYITEVDGEFEADTFFPSFDKSKYKEISKEKHSHDERNKYNYKFVVYKKKGV